MTFFVYLPNCLIIFVKVSEKMWEWITKQCKYLKKKIDEVLQQNKGKLKFSLFRLYIKENNERVFFLALYNCVYRIKTLVVHILILFLCTTSFILCALFQIATMHFHKNFAFGSK